MTKYWTKLCIFGTHKILMLNSWTIGSYIETIDFGFQYIFIQSYLDEIQQYRIIIPTTFYYLYKKLNFEFLAKINS